MLHQKIDKIMTLINQNISPVHNSVAKCPELINTLKR